MWIEAVAAVFTTLGTVGVAVAAVFGDRIKDCLFGPRLKLSLVDAVGEKIPRQNGTYAFFYHIRDKMVAEFR